jgi:prepilin-type N-terminal cleavage/methylation domain-containing protein
VGSRTVEVDRRGFTLLEVLVVLFVVALAVSLTAPTIARSTDLIKARAEVAGFSALLRFAREQAITLRQQQSVVVDPQERRVALVADGEVRRTRLLSPKWTIEANPSTHLTVSFEPEGSSSGGEFRLTASGVTYRVTVEPMTGRVRSTRQ